jgi:phospholipid-binding lipoprotein MlaA
LKDYSILFATKHFIIFIFQIFIVGILFFGCSKDPSTPSTPLAKTSQNNTNASDNISQTKNKVIVKNNEVINEEESDFEFEDEEEQEEEPIFDPLEGYNILMTDFNDVIYIYVFNPIVNGYVYVTPTFLREGFNNMLHILFFPTNFVNHLLQVKLVEASKQTLRVIINFTIGIFGFFDVATHMGLKKHNEDFGQTLAYWGVGSGFPVVLPFLGPSNVRDMFSIVVDGYINLPYDLTSEQKLKINAFYLLNYGSFYMPYYDDLKKDAIGEPYYFFQDAYRQKRLAEIND